MASSSRQHKKHKASQSEIPALLTLVWVDTQGSLTLEGLLNKQDPPDYTLLKHHLGEFAAIFTIFKLCRSESNADNCHTNYAGEVPHLIMTPSRTGTLIRPPDRLNL